jgi:hypothetical protein
MDRDYPRTFKGLVAVCKRACCAQCKLYSLKHVSSQGQVLSGHNPHRSGVFGAQHHSHAVVVQCGAVDSSDTERTMFSVLHVDCDIGPVRVVPALTWITWLGSCRPFWFFSFKINIVKQSSENTKKEDGKKNK